MHFYPFDIAEYMAHTPHLNADQDLTYRRMLDYCYLHERGLPSDVDEIAELIKMPSQCVGIILKQFFHQGDNGVWHNNRADREIARFRSKSVKGRDSANRRWQGLESPETQKSPRGGATGRKPTPKKAPSLSAEQTEKALQLFLQFWLQYPWKIAKLSSELEWLLLSEAEQELALRVIPDHVKVWAVDQFKYVPKPTNWIKQKRFTDELKRMPLPAAHKPVEQQEETEEERKINAQKAMDKMNELLRKQGKIK